MDRFDPFVKYADVYGDIINWEKDPMNKPQNQNKYFFSDGKTYYEQICKMLRLMSVFKEAFNQIYSNEDEISEAWENFVNNLSASVVEGSEPDVTLTWTDDSVNFEFTMVPGVPGEQGVGITSITFNSDYTMTITLSDGNTYTSMSLKGETGPQGPQGETGSGLQILDVYPTLADLQSAHPTGQPGDAYQVGSAGSYTLYIWSSSQSAWVPAGSLGTVSPSVSNPLMDGTASAGSLDQYSRGDHVHPTDTSRASKEELDALIKTSQALIDQSFTYRESPAIQDGLARFDKIKGNTLVWNQLFNAIPSSSSDGITTEYNETTHIFSITNNSRTSNYSSGSTRGNLNFSLVKDHKYFIRSSKDVLGVVIGEIGGIFHALNSIFTAVADYDTPYLRVTYQYDFVTAHPVGDVTSFYLNVFDLTKMGLDSITDPAEFASIFPIPFYDYNAGSLLSFNGNGLKTIGFNQWDEEWEVGAYNSLDGSKADNVRDRIRNKNPIRVFPSVNYFKNKGLQVYYYDANMNFIGWNSLGSTGIFTLPSNACYMNFNGVANSGTSYNNDLCINISDPERNGTYEPYKESLLNLPVSQYFPTGMKSTERVRDELTDNKATTRTEKEIYTSSTGWTTRTTGSGWILYEIAPSDIKDVGTPQNATIKNNRFEWVLDLSDNNTIRQVGGRISVRKDDITSLDAWGTYLASNPLEIIYELATPVETAVDLDLDFISYQDGTEQLLPVNGPVPSTSPIIADMTYLSIDDAMEYVLEKLANVPENTQQILESLEDDVTDLQTDVGALQTSVSGLQTSVGNINTNIGQLSSTVAGHTASISDMQSDITDLNTGLNDLNTGLNDLEDTVTNNTSRIGTLETGLTNTDSQVDAIDARVLNLETDLLIVVKKEYDYDSVAGNTNFGVQTGLSQEPGYKIIGIVGSEVQQGEYTSAEPWIIVTQAHVHYTSTGGVVLSMMARNVSEYTKTNVRVYLYLLCIKDTQSQ